MKFLSKYLYVLCLLFSFSIKAQLKEEQIQEIDSLKKIISTAKHDSIKINALSDWDGIIYISNPALSLELNQRIQDICILNLRNKLNASELKKFKISLGKCYNIIGICFW